MAVKPDIPDAWRSALCSWASATNAVRELWLFGSRAKGYARPESDVDLAIELMAAHAGTLAVKCLRKWNQQLEAILGRHVSLTIMSPNLSEEVRDSAILLWSRDRDISVPA
jgi:predicted nucleotidyltransferase